MEMNSEQNLQLEDAEKKLSAFRSHLNLLVEDVWKSKNLDTSEILSAINELQSLVQWAAQQPELGEESVVLLGKLQELHRLQQNLENTPANTEECNASELINIEGNEASEKAEICKETDTSGIVTENPLENEGEVNTEVITEPNESISPDSQFTSRTEEANTAPCEETSEMFRSADEDNWNSENIETGLNNEERCSDSTEDAVIINSDTELQDFLSSDSELLIRSDTEIQESPTTECNDLTKSDRKEQELPPSETSTKNNVEIEDLISSEVKDLSEINIEVEESVSGDTETLTASNTVEAQESIASDDESLMKSNTELKDAPSDQADAVEEINTEIQNAPSNETTVVAEDNKEIEVLPVTDSENLKESNSETQDAPSNESEDLNKNSGANDSESVGNKPTTESSTETFDSESADNENTTRDTADEIRSQSPENETIIKSDTEAKSLIRCSSERKSIKKEVRILETNEDNKTTELIDDSRNSSDPLDVCMFAIRNLYDSLRTKENELLKLSVMQSDQKHIEALQGVIIDFHKDVTNLNSQLDKTKKENNLLKEQVLELEEAENDARLEAQKLGQKLSFLQEKDSHSQAELHQLKVSLKKSAEKLVEKESSEKELRSQIKYLEALVQKYEEQIKGMETKITTLSEKIPEPVPEKEVNDNAVNTEKPESYNKGTQTYVPCEARIRYSKTDILHESDSIDSGDLDSNGNENAQVSDESKVLPSKAEGSDSSITQNVSVSLKEATNPEEEAVSGSIQKLTQKELLERLHKLVDDDVSLQQQIHSLDQINLDLWKKLQNLENNIGECKRKDINETDPSVNNTEIKDSVNDVAGTEAAELSSTVQQNYIPRENLNSLDQNEQCIQERLSKLEEINASFEQELKTRENLCKEKEKKCEEWMQTEKRLMTDLKRLAEEKDSLVDQVAKLKKEKETLEQRIFQQESELQTLKDKNEMEIIKIKTEQETVILQHQHKVNSLQTKEKELLKMITKLKSERNRNENKTELERLKCKYIELQLELSNSRDEIEKLEEKFKIRIKECISKHLEEETRVTALLEHLRKDNERCDKMISDLQMKQQQLLNALEKQGNELIFARESYNKNLEDTEEVHRSVEIELKNQLQQIEESTVIATTALMEERGKVEKELQENIDDLSNTPFKLPESSQNFPFGPHVFLNIQHNQIKLKRAKEEVYKARITELEHNVVSLRDELHKVSDGPELKMDTTAIQENLEDKKVDNIKESTSLNITSDVPVGSQTVEKDAGLEKDLKISSSETVRCATPTVPTQPELPSKSKTEGIVVKKIKKEENVEHLRAQVRELQAQLDRISGEPVDILPVPPTPPVKPVSPISAPSMGLKKEDIDYAEVDDCLDAWRKPSKTPPSNKTFPLQYQAVYKNRYDTRYKQSSTKQKDHPVQEESEDNDYDEVLPRPTNFHVVQQVGSDTLLVGWNYVNPSLLDGFEVYLDNQVHERIYIPDRTKALISGLNLRRPIHLSICALSRYGQMSEPTVLDLPAQTEMNEQYFEDEDEEEYRDFENSMYRKQRPYSMEW